MTEFADTAEKPETIHVSDLNTTQSVTPLASSPVRKTLTFSFVALLAVSCGSSKAATTSAATAKAAAANATATTKAPAASVAPEATGDLPKVTGDAKSKPVIEMPKSAAPAKLVVKILTPGTGADVKSGQQIKVQYVGQIWATGDQFDASWDRGQPIEFGIGTGKVIQGWDEGLVGQKIGSRVLLVIPPDKGYGAGGRPPKIKGTDTMVFVVDIVDSK
jgi:FKBP-type peptidyl-prolyl cis-trans isomerase